ncbi:uncharacterized protein MONBRDRAFT_24267 [Monosiga brevicollis MX1]|uniref:MHD2 domain-containing protein n=1 Tax=Monosiga brevicollis TaxID=81824 RepID=A9UVW7_MONBE|nr:uncharacterized protein MONBRDRAFT_24267 [Monosiga brevicollis MX1]EDQ90661.1 predicted protein [Monosiga brevicollis MX1]|eukprot:XP_001744712.1 hypothetical protein [Monosiga brevicollis MX1]
MGLSFSAQLRASIAAVKCLTGHHDKHHTRRDPLVLVDLIGHAHEAGTVTSTKKLMEELRAHQIELRAHRQPAHMILLELARQLSAVNFQRHEYFRLDTFTDDGFSQWRSSESLRLTRLMQRLREHPDLVHTPAPTPRDGDFHGSQTYMLHYACLFRACLVADQSLFTHLQPDLSYPAQSLLREYALQYGIDDTHAALVQLRALSDLFMLSEPFLLRLHDALQAVLFLHWPPLMNAQTGIPLLQEGQSPSTRAASSKHESTGAQNEARPFNSAELIELEVAVNAIYHDITQVLHTLFDFFPSPAEAGSLRLLISSLGVVLKILAHHSWTPLQMTSASGESVAPATLELTEQVAQALDAAMQHRFQRLLNAVHGLDVMSASATLSSDGPLRAAVPGSLSESRHRLRAPPAASPAYGSPTIGNGSVTGRERTDSFGPTSGPPAAVTTAAAAAAASVVAAAVPETASSLVDQPPRDHFEGRRRSQRLVELHQVSGQHLQQLLAMLGPDLHQLVQQWSAWWPAYDWAHRAPQVYLWQFHELMHSHQTSVTAFDHSDFIDARLVGLLAQTASFLRGISSSTRLEDIERTEAIFEPLIIRWLGRIQVHSEQTLATCFRANESFVRVFDLRASVDLLASGLDLTHAVSALLRAGMSLCELFSTSQAAVMARQLNMAAGELVRNYMLLLLSIDYVHIAKCLEADLNEDFNIRVNANDDRQLPDLSFAGQRTTWFVFDHPHNKATAYDFGLHKSSPDTSQAGERASTNLEVWQELPGEAIDRGETPLLDLARPLVERRRCRLQAQEASAPGTGRASLADNNGLAKDLSDLDLYASARDGVGSEPFSSNTTSPMRSPRAQQRFFGQRSRDQPPTRRERPSIKRRGGVSSEDTGYVSTQRHGGPLPRSAATTRPASPHLSDIDSAFGGDGAHSTTSELLTKSLPGQMGLHQVMPDVSVRLADGESDASSQRMVRLSAEQLAGPAMMQASTFFQAVALYGTFPNSALQYAMDLLGPVQMYAVDPNACARLSTLCACQRLMRHFDARFAQLLKDREISFTLEDDSIHRYLDGIVNYLAGILLERTTTYLYGAFRILLLNTTLKALSTADRWRPITRYLEAQLEDFRMYCSPAAYQLFLKRLWRRTIDALMRGESLEPSAVFAVMQQHAVILHDAVEHILEFFARIEPKLCPLEELKASTSNVVIILWLLKLQTPTLLAVFQRLSVYQLGLAVGIGENTLGNSLFWASPTLPGLFSPLALLQAFSQRPASERTVGLASRTIVACLALCAKEFECASYSSPAQALIHAEYVVSALNVVVALLRDILLADGLLRSRGLFFVNELCLRGPYDPSQLHWCRLSETKDLVSWIQEHGRFGGLLFKDMNEDSLPQQDFPLLSLERAQESDIRMCQIEDILQMFSTPTAFTDPVAEKFPDLKLGDLVVRVARRPNLPPDITSRPQALLLCSHDCLYATDDAPTRRYRDHSDALYRFRLDNCEDPQSLKSFNRTPGQGFDAVLQSPPIASSSGPTSRTHGLRWNATTLDAKSFTGVIVKWPLLAHMLHGLEVSLPVCQPDELKSQLQMTLRGRPNDPFALVFLTSLPHPPADVS